jgi:hypothetical protein
MTSESDQKEYRHTTLQQPALHCATNEVGLRPALHTAGESTIAAIGASSRPLRNSQVIVPAGLADRGNTSEHSFLRKRPDRQKFNPKKKRENDCWAQHNLPLRLTRSFGGRFLGVLPPRPRSSLETQRAEGVSTARHSSLPSGVPRLGQTFSHPSPGFWGSRAKSLTADPDSWPRFPIMRITGESVGFPPRNVFSRLGRPRLIENLGCRPHMSRPSARGVRSPGNGPTLGLAIIWWIRLLLPVPLTPGPHCDPLPEPGLFARFLIRR